MYKIRHTKLNTKYGQIYRVKNFKYFQIIEPTREEKVTNELRLQKMKKAWVMTKNL